MSAPQATTKEAPDQDGSETPTDSLAGPSEVKEDTATFTTSAAMVEPMGGVPSSLTSNQPEKDITDADDDDAEAWSPPSSPLNRPTAGEA
ncbi:hypothetical protein ILYODFUR_024050 [Ilyodon furcidens]|uniref:Uncharacterized protein n=1 Tax=Ilyodon furcidens TaxID=33524 RepID=A0ABV0UV11_9TELE